MMYIQDIYIYSGNDKYENTEKETFEKDRQYLFLTPH